METTFNAERFLECLRFLQTRDLENTSLGCCQTAEMVPSGTFGDPRFDYIDSQRGDYIRSSDLEDLLRACGIPEVSKHGL